MRWGLYFMTLSLPFLWTSTAIAQDSSDTQRTEMTIRGAPTRPLEPPLTYSMPVSALTYEPQVDVEARNGPEAQGDITIRGGTFENTGISIGALDLFDPQTGHYLLELPVDPRMLSNPSIRTGLQSSLQSFNATAGSIEYDWSRIRQQGVSAQIGVADHSTNVTSVYGAARSLTSSSQGALNADVSYSHSKSHGTRRHGDSDFDRISGRLQWETPDSQTDFVMGYQEKSFSWPYLYALQELHDLVGSSGIESELLHTTLVTANHQHKVGDKSSLSIGAFFRHHTDDYDFDRFNPNLFNAFRHNTDMFGGALEGNFQLSEGGGYRTHLQTKFDYAEDDIDSSSLLFGRFSSRRYLMTNILPGVTLDLGSEWALDFNAGVSGSDTNRDQGRISPLAGAAITHSTHSTAWERYYVDASQSSQVASYTALSSNPAAGLFRGNSELNRTVSTNYEGGVEIQRGEIRGKAALFHRLDNDLVDWTYTRDVKPFAARSAKNVDVDVTGVEVASDVRFSPTTFRVGYTYLLKDADYGAGSVDASFYALNYARHRATVGLNAELSEDITFQWDNELRRQVANELRSSTQLTYYISSAALTWRVPEIPGLALVGSISNITNEDFEEVPGVPGAQRLAGLEARFRF
jgi:vitamin B12 transporter